MLGFPITWTHGSITLNGHLDTDGSTFPNIESLTRIVVDRAVPRPAFRDTVDPLHLATGGTLGRVHRGMTIIDVSGRIIAAEDNRADTDAILGDTARALRAAFDPAVCLRDSPTTEGAYQWRFTERSADTATYSPNGLIAQVYFARPVRQIIIPEENQYPRERRFDLMLIAPDPRAYEQVEQTLTLAGGSLSGSVSNRGTVASPLKAVITMSGAGSANYTLTRDGVTFGLDLSGTTGGDIVSVYMEASGAFGLTLGRKIFKNSSNAFSLKTTAASTWLDVPVGSTTFTVANATNASTELLWHSARP